MAMLNNQRVYIYVCVPEYPESSSKPSITYGSPRYTRQLSYSRGNHLVTSVWRFLNNLLPATCQVDGNVIGNVKGNLQEYEKLKFPPICQSKVLTRPNLPIQSPKKNRNKTRWWTGEPNLINWNRGIFKTRVLQQILTSWHAVYVAQSIRRLSGAPFVASAVFLPQRVQFLSSLDGGSVELDAASQIDFIPSGNLT
jgi:hypothetical protein